MKYNLEYYLLIRTCQILYEKAIATLRAIIIGDASIKYAGKTPIKRTPGDTTQMPHN